MTIRSIYEDDECYKMVNSDHHWTDEMIECKVEKETKVGTASNPIEPKSNANCLTQEKVDETKPEPKFKVGDKVKWYNHISYIKSIDTYENTYIYLIKYDDYREDATFVKWVPESELTFEDDVETKPKYEDEVNGEYYSTPKYIVRPNGYQFVDENGNVINAQKIVLEKKKKEYPKTYEECCKIMQVARPIIWFDYDDVSSISAEGDEYESHIENTLCAFRKLLICRDAYWKIAGEEMGLGKPWEPDSDTEVYNIYRFRDEINISCSYCVGNSNILEFPTAEMRDAFYENFKELIEQCKELL